MKLAQPVFFLAGHNWPLINWSIAVPDVPDFQRAWASGYSTDLKTVLEHDFKIAVLPVFCNVPGTAWYDPIMDLVDLAQFDLVLLADIEYSSIKSITAWIEQNKIKNYLLALGGLHANETPNPDCMVYSPWWLFQTINNSPYQSTSQVNKPFCFEGMLGSRRWHRDRVWIELNQINLLDQNIINYRSLYKPAQAVDDPRVTYPYTSPNFTNDLEIDRLPNGTMPILGIPWNLYRVTNYSIVCETIYNEQVFFITEKTAKPIWSKRLFIMVGCVNFLKHLQRLGFKTFDSVIDESYDSETDHKRRFAMAVEQIKYLSQQNPAPILEKIQPVLDHNYRKVMQLQQEVQQQMQNLLAQHIPSNLQVLD